MICDVSVVTKGFGLEEGVQCWRYGALARIFAVVDTKFP